MSSLRKRTEAIFSDFVTTELDLALTFYDIAHTTEDPERAERNIENARRAFESAKDFVSRMKRNGHGYDATIDERLVEMEPHLYGDDAITARTPLR